MKGDWAKLVYWLKQFIPVFVLAMFLPFFVFLILKPPQLKFFSGATGEKVEFRVWIEPQTVVASVGREVEMRVMGSFVSERDSVLAVSLVVGGSDGSLAFDKREVAFKEPFSGETELGVVKVTPLKTGEYELEIDPRQVEVMTSGVEVEVVGGRARLVAR